MPIHILRSAKQARCLRSLFSCDNHDAAAHLCMCRCPRVMYVHSSRPRIFRCNWPRAKLKSSPVHTRVRTDRKRGGGVAFFPGVFFFEFQMPSSAGRHVRLRQAATLVMLIATIRGAGGMEPSYAFPRCAGRGAGGVGVSTPAAGP